MPWRLESAVARAAGAPDTFEIPPAKVRSRLRKGDGAKLLFFLDDEEGNAGVERMWVSVTDVGPDHYSGRLENEPLTQGVIERGALVSFTPEHVADVVRPRFR